MEHELKRIDLDWLMRRAVFLAALNLVGEKDDFNFVPVFIIIDAVGDLHTELVPCHGQDEFNAALAAIGDSMRKARISTYAFVMNVSWVPKDAVTSHRLREYLGKV
jgi:hypothetical protein